MDEQAKEQLIAQFRAYLESDFIPDEPEAIIDRMTLFNELAGLKNEVRIESRQLKGALDDFRLAFTSLDQAHQDTANILHHIEQQERESARTAFKPVILGLIELYDRIGAGLQSKPPDLPLFLRLLNGGRHSQKWMTGHLEGQQMIFGRVLDLLNQCGVSAMDTASRKFDPNCMKAVAFQADPEQEQGMVLQENRKGFRQGERILRPAEVIVNKREE